MSQIPQSPDSFHHRVFAPLRHCFSSQIKTRLRWAFDLYLKQCAKLRFVDSNLDPLIRKVQ